MFNSFICISVFCRIPKDLLLRTFIESYPDLVDKINTRKLIDNARNYRTRCPNLVKLAELRAISKKETMEFNNNTQVVGNNNITNNTTIDNDSTAHSEQVTNSNITTDEQTINRDYSMQEIVEETPPDEIKQLSQLIQKEAEWEMRRNNDISKRKRIKRKPMIELDKINE